MTPHSDGTNDAPPETVSTSVLHVPSPFGVARTVLRKSMRSWHTPELHGWTVMPQAEPPAHAAG